MSTQITLESFIRLLEEDCFVDYLNKFLCLPIFGQRLIYRKKEQRYLIEPSLPEDSSQIEKTQIQKTNEITKWIWEERLTFFFKSYIYGEYKLAKALIEFDLVADGGVEENIAHTLEDLQFFAFSRMSRFSKFVNFLSETAEGLKLVAFFVAAQHTLVAYYDGDQDVVIYIGDLRDRFFDDTSRWCLPKSVLTNLLRSEQPTSIAFCMTVCQRVLSRICFYWLPRYLLFLKIEKMQKSKKYEIDCASQYLHEFLGRIESMNPNEARASVSLTGLDILSQNPQTAQNAQVLSNTKIKRHIKIRLPEEHTFDDYDMDKTRSRDSLAEMDNEDMFDSSLDAISEEPTKGIGTVFNLPKLDRTKSILRSPRKESTMMRKESHFGRKGSQYRKESQFRKESKFGASVAHEKRISKRTMSKHLAIPGLDIKVERRKSQKQNTELSSKLSDNQGSARKETMCRQTATKQEYFRSTRAMSRMANNDLAKPSSSRTGGLKVNLFDGRRRNSNEKGSVKKSLSMAALSVRARNVSTAVSKFKVGSKLSVAKSSIGIKSSIPPSTDKKLVSLKITADNVFVSKLSPKTISPKKSGTTVVGEDKTQTSVTKQNNPKDSEPETSEEDGSDSPNNSQVHGPSLLQVVRAKKMAGLWRQKGSVLRDTSVSGKKQRDELDRGKKPLLASKIMDKIKEKNNAKKIAEKEKTQRKGSLDKKKMEINEDEGQKDGVTKMVFAMSDQQNENEKTVKVVQKKNNRLTEDVQSFGPEKKAEDDDSETGDDDDPIPVLENYLRKRRNALGKIKPLRTLRKARPQQTKDITRTERRNTHAQKNSSSIPQNEKSSRDQKKDNRKAEFIRKALMTGPMISEKIEVPEYDNDSDSGFGDGYTNAFYSVQDDHIYRHEMRHFQAALRSDDFSAGPFMFFLTDNLNDEMSMMTLCFWQEVERFREEFAGMQIIDLQLEFESLISKYVFNDKGIQLLPGMKDVGGFLLEIDIQTCATFPWPLRLLQRRSMEHLNIKWKEFIEYDMDTFYQRLAIADNIQTSISSTELVDRQVKSVKACFATEILPIPLPHEIKETQSATENESDQQNSNHPPPVRRTTSRQDARLPGRPVNKISGIGNQLLQDLDQSRDSNPRCRPTDQSRDSSPRSRPTTPSRPPLTRCASRDADDNKNRPASPRNNSPSTNRSSQPGNRVANRPSNEHSNRGTIPNQDKTSEAKNNDIRATIGYRSSQIMNKTRAELLRSAMSRRTKRAYLLAEQTCRITANIPHSEGFMLDESDDEGFLKPKPPPIYLRPPNIEMKTLALLSAHEYPSRDPNHRRRTRIRNIDKTKAPTYLKETIRKNGVILKRPMIRPKHLVDCLRDPVHFEFFRRFAKAFHFERSVRFWKSVQVMKHIEDPKIRQMKIRGIVGQYFSKGATTGVGVDGQVMREIMRTAPEKVNVSMLISAQACVMKALEDGWGDRYLSTFTDVKKSQLTKSRFEHHEKMQLSQNQSKMTNIWRIFSCFIRRGAKFISCMRNRHLRNQFELYLQNVGRDPTVYHKEGWIEIAATNIDPQMPPDLMYHQKKQQGRHIIAELLIHDFRFWCEVECYRAQAESVQQNNEAAEYDPIDEAILNEKAKLICDQFIQSTIAPKCRINIQPEISSTVIENVKLGMFDRSLFHDLTLNIFPLLLNYWKTFCERRHEYVSRNELRNYRREMVVKRRKKVEEQIAENLRKHTIISSDSEENRCSSSARPRRTKSKKTQSEIRMSRPNALVNPLIRGDGDSLAKRITQTSKAPRSTIGLRDMAKRQTDPPLIDYCDKKHKYFRKSWIDLTKSSYDDLPTMNFTLTDGVKLSIPTKKCSVIRPATREDPADDTNEVGQRKGSRPLRSLAVVATQQKQRIRSAKIIDQLKMAATQGSF